MPWSDLLGQDRAVGMLRAALRSDRLHHALMFHGPEGVGKATAARLLAQAIFCAAGGADSCSLCSSCRRVASGNHPDLLWVGLAVSASTGKLRQEIVIEQVRELTRFLTFRPLEGRSRMAVVDPADQMNAAAANAFLKTLEEPPGAARLVLICRNPASLLDTIRSRCQPVRFGRLPAGPIEKELRRLGADEKDSRLAASLADGAVGRAIRLLAPDADSGTPLAVYRLRRDRVLEALTACTAPGPSPGSRALRAAETFSSKDPVEFQACLDIAEALLRDALVVATGGASPTAASDAPGAVEALARQAGPARLARAIATAERLRADLRVNISRQLGIEAFLLEITAPEMPGAGARGPG